MSLNGPDVGGRERRDFQVPNLQSQADGGSTQGDSCPQLSRGRGRWQPPVGQVAGALNLGDTQHCPHRNYQGVESLGHVLH